MENGLTSPTSNCIIPDMQHLRYHPEDYLRSHQTNSTDSQSQKKPRIFLSKISTVFVN